jgi:hypothetical protein
LLRSQPKPSRWCLTLPRWLATKLDRETQILRYLASHLQPAQIAAAMRLSSQRRETGIEIAFGQTGVSCRDEPVNLVGHYGAL